MSFLGQKRFRLGCVLAICLMLAGVAIWRWGLFRSNNRIMETPKIVDVSVTVGKSRRKLRIRDPTAIAVLQTLIEGGRAVSGNPPRRREFEIFVHPTGKSTYTYSPSPVWRTTDGGFAWRHDGQTTELNGSLTDFIEWLKIRRLNQMLRNPDPEQRQLAQTLRDSSRPEHVESLLRIANSTNGWFAQAGIREISELISIDPPILNRFIAGEMYLPQRPAVVDPNRRVRDALLELVARCPRAEHTDDSFGTGDAALQCLQTIGDRATADALVKLLKRHQSERFGDQLLKTIDGLYGIPATYERFGICGNSTAEEMAGYAREATRRQVAAIDDLLAWRTQHVDSSDEEFYDAVVLRWSEMLIHFVNTPNRFAYHSDRTPAPKLADLLGLGEPIVPALGRRKEAATSWAEAAMLEFCIAFLTGECDADLVTKLLAGDVSQQRVACSIIAATADPTWNDRVAELLRTPIPDRNVEEVVVLRDVAAQAIYRSRGVTALPELRTALNEGFESQMLLQILDRLEVPVAEF